MAMVADGQAVTDQAAERREMVGVLALYAGTLFLSALLLFSVQPMFAKMVLPKLGGSPSVWAVSMCFFQATLLAGYCYAHALNRYAPARFAPLIHLLLMAVAAITLPIGLRSGWSEPPAGDAYLWLTGALATGVGLPFFAVAANAPLLQAWFARSGHPHGRDPYFLYGASNCGSLLALLAYPFVIEPTAGLVMQSALWTAGFVALGGTIALSALAMVRALPASGSAAVADASRGGVSARPTWGTRAAWIGLSAVPSGLLVAFSTHLTTDIASAPFLWVMPLALYLLTFILAFREKPIVGLILQQAQPMIVAVVLYGLTQPGRAGWLIVSILGTIAFFLTTLVAHRELYERRPAPEHLTEFYLIMSLGGVLGGVFAAAVAPQIFNVVWEFPLLLVAGMACRPGVFQRALDTGEKRRLALIVAISLAVMITARLTMDSGLVSMSRLRASLLCMFGFVALISFLSPFRQFLFIALMGAAIAILPSAINNGDAERSFFGVHRVYYTPDKQLRVLMHGTTVHGAERIRDAAGRRIETPTPATYYYPGGPMVKGIDAARVASGKLETGLVAGVVGLGAGSLACSTRAGESWRFYEIDPVVVKVARDPKRFTFLSRCRPDADIVLGDARLTLTREPAGKFDYLLIDAFSSDAVPVHLLTVEALQLYFDKLAPNGILAMHVSNRHLDLAEVLAAVLKRMPGVQAVLADDQLPNSGYDQATSTVVFMARTDQAMQPLKVYPYIQPMPETGIAPWTDDYSDILGAMLRKSR